MKDFLLQECEQLIIDFAQKRNMSPSDMLSKFQMALLDVARWVCEYYQYTDEEYESFMRGYANNITDAINRRFRKEK